MQSTDVAVRIRSEIRMGEIRNGVGEPRIGVGDCGREPMTIGVDDCKREPKIGVDDCKRDNM